MAADSTYRILGRREEPVHTLGQDAVQISKLRRLVPGRARDAEVDVVDVHANDVVRMELDNGFVLWGRAEDLLRERGRRTATRSGVEAWEIDPLPRSTGRDGTRGIVGIAIKVLDFFGVDLNGKAARALGEQWEKRRLEVGRKPGDGSTGLYHCSMGDEFQLIKPKKDDLLSVDHPFLLFIHGTGSSCWGSFGKLWDSDTKAGKAVREILAKQYPDRVYSFEHLSLSHSPITNTLDLAKLLPNAADLHLVTHSRGGLIGELLCLGERDPSSDPLKPDLIEELFRLDRVLEKQIGLGPLDGEARQVRDDAYADDRKRLVELLDLLAEKRFRIRRFVRCACPARGTTLASGRLDRWLSMLDFIGKVTGGVAGDIVDFILAVIQERTDPRTLPGLEAMMPGSALTRLLHHPDLVTASDLTVIAGDIEGDSLWTQLKLFVSDWFYGADHDLVVNTGSMYGGIRRQKGAARFQFDQGPGVSHASYFENDRSVRWLLNGLTGVTEGFRPLEEAKHEEPRWRAAVRRSQSVNRPQPLAVVLPGTMGSSLSAQGERVWLNSWKLMRGGLKKLRTGEPDIESTDLLDDFYGPLLEYLAHSHRVEIFPYDWRLSICESAAALTRKLEGWLTEPERWKKPVHLVAHSMGGLVVRAMIADGGAGEAQLDDRVRISAIEFVELYQDVAIEAAEALNRGLESGQLDPSIVWPRREIEEGV